MRDFILTMQQNNIRKAYKSMVFNEVNKKDFILDILVACEESQEVCKAFREKGHNAFSCDIMECSGNHPEWHIKDNVLPLLNGNCSFKTMDGKEHKIGRASCRERV